MWKNDRPRKLPPIPWTCVMKIQLKKIIMDLQYEIHNLKDSYFDKLYENEFLNCELIKLKHDYKNLIDKHSLHLQSYNTSLTKYQRKLSDAADLIAYLYQEIERKDDAISNILRRNNNFTVQKEKKLTCECCYDEVTSENIIKCNNGHSLCKECVNNMCKIKNNNFEIPVNEICCGSIHDCDGVINEVKLYSTEEGQKLLRNYYIMGLAPHLLQYIKKYKIQEIEKNVTFLNYDMSFRAYQCSKCGYGPLLHEHCDNLETHDGQEVNGVRIKNSCPSCDKLTRDVKKLSEWNGFS